MTRHYQYEREIEAVVHGFETCTTSKEAFTHREHLTVAAWYLCHDTAEGAVARMRSGLIRFLTHHQVDPGKYKEDLTVGWMNLVEQTLAELPTGLSTIEVTNSVVDRLGDSRLVPEASRSK